MTKLNYLKFTQKIPITIETAWDFFSSPQNLSKITPQYLDFKITSIPENKSMYSGQIITYTVSPMLGIKLNWMTEITHVSEYQYFIDEQRLGPYNMWHHQHHFKPIVGGVEMTDIIHYILPFGIFGSLSNKLFVKSQLNEIFKYRLITIEHLFGKF